MLQNSPEARIPGAPAKGLMAMPAERRMTRRAMCDSRERIQEGASRSREKGFNGNHMSDFEGHAKVEIYTKWGCGFCSRAKALLAGKGVEFEEFDITMGGPKRDEMLARSNGGTTVPQIFIGGVHVGGSDDLSALNRTGKLDMLLGW